MKRTFSFKRTADGSRGDGLPIACGLASFFARGPEGRGIAKPQALHEPTRRVPTPKSAVYRNPPWRLLSSFILPLSTLNSQLSTLFR